MNLDLDLAKAVNRRYFFGRCGEGLGLGAIALATLLKGEARGSGLEVDPSPATRTLPTMPRARHAST